MPVGCAVTDSMLKNVALHKNAYQVSTYEDEFERHPAHLANDGNLQTNYKVTSGGCAASELATNPWWAVDLTVRTIVFMVKLTNRKDDKGAYTAIAIYTVRHKTHQNLSIVTRRPITRF